MIAKLCSAGYSVEWAASAGKVMASSHPNSTVRLHSEHGEWLSRPSPIVHADTNWATPACLIADTTGPTGHQLFVVGQDQYAGGQTVPLTNCHGPLPVATQRLAAISPIPPFTAGFRELIDAPPGPASLNPPDVIITRDPVVLAYATSRADFMVKPSLWTAT